MEQDPHQKGLSFFFMQFVSKTYIQKCLMVKVRHIFLISDYSNLIQIYGISGSTK